MLSETWLDDSIDDSILSLFNCFNVSSRMDTPSNIGGGVATLTSVNLPCDIYPMSSASGCDFYSVVALNKPNRPIYLFVLFYIPPISRAFFIPNE